MPFRTGNLAAVGQSSPALRLQGGSPAAARMRILYGGAYVASHQVQITKDKDAGPWVPFEAAKTAPGFTDVTGHWEDGVYVRLICTAWTSGAITYQI